MRKKTAILISLLLLVGLFVMPVFAEEMDQSLFEADLADAPQSGDAESSAANRAVGAFGTQTQDYWIASPQFAARTGSKQWSYDSYLYFTTGTSGQYEAQVELPAGAQVTTLECFFYDTSASNASVGFWKHSYDYVTNTPSVSSIALISSSGSGGYQKPSQSINETILYRDGDARNIYTLTATMPGDTNVRLRGCRFLWRRQISPAPGTATFPDVPVSHWAFQYIEALADSGITTGYGDGTYRPNNNITRAEMAVFMARALGLHWPY